MNCFSSIFIFVTLAVYGTTFLEKRHIRSNTVFSMKKYPISKLENSYKYNQIKSEQMKREQQLRKQNSKNASLQINQLLNNEDLDIEQSMKILNKLLNKINSNNHNNNETNPQEGSDMTQNLKLSKRIIVKKGVFIPLFMTREVREDGDITDADLDYDDDTDGDDDNEYDHDFDHEDDDYDDDEYDDDEEDMRTEYEKYKNLYEVTKIADGENTDMFGGMNGANGANGASATSRKINRNSNGNIRSSNKKRNSLNYFRDLHSKKKRTFKKTENFEMNAEASITFKDVGGYENIKKELSQCIDILSNYTKYAKYNVRVPKGLIFEGPPGNGKTLFAKALAGEANTNFIAVSGSQFQDKYVGVGSSRVRELFKFAKENIPCIIFIDEIDAVGRRRSSDGEASSGERDNTLNELLISLDGFKNTSGVFIIGATNRPDLLDTALIRPGRIDKRIYINNPDKVTRKSIISIHIHGKPHDKTIDMDILIEQTEGFSAAQIENLLNEAMLNALRMDRSAFSSTDIDIVVNKMLAGWQPTEHEFSQDLIGQIAIHELGHAVVGVLCKHHAKMTKVVINLSSPRSPAYTVFESSPANLMTREELFEHLMVLLSGRIAEEAFYDVSVSTGAINDFEEAHKLAEKMICYYGMGTNIIYPSLSDKYKEAIDLEVSELIHDAYQQSKFIIHNFKDLIEEGADMLKRDNILTSETLMELISRKYKHLFSKLSNSNFCK